MTEYQYSATFSGTLDLPKSLEEYDYYEVLEMVARDASQGKLPDDVENLGEL